VWVGTVKLRKIRIEKMVEMRKVKDVMKLYKILNGQLYLLSEWAKLERRNQESVARLTRKLSALSTIIPLTYLKVYITCSLSCTSSKDTLINSEFGMCYYIVKECE